MAKLKINLDMSDVGLEKCAPVETNISVAKEDLDISHFGVPVAQCLMIQPVICQACGEEHYEHQGVCLELHYTQKTRAWRKLDMLEAAAYRHLPRKIEYMPMLTIDFCHVCFTVDEIVGIFFKDPDHVEVDIHDLTAPMERTPSAAMPVAGRDEAQPIESAGSALCSTDSGGRQDSVDSTAMGAEPPPQDLNVSSSPTLSAVQGLAQS